MNLRPTIDMNSPLLKSSARLRRQLLLGLAGVALAAPLALQAQTQAKVIRIGAPDFGMAGNGRLDALGLGGNDGDCVVESQRAVEQAALDLAAVGHLAQGGSVQSGLNFRVDRFNRGKNRHLGFRNADDVRHVDGVLDDVNLVFQRRGDIDRRIGNQQRTVIGRDVHQENVADAAGCPQAGGARHHFSHQFIRVQAALHQGFRITGTYQ